MLEFFFFFSLSEIVPPILRKIAFGKVAPVGNLLSDIIAPDVHILVPSKLDSTPRYGDCRFNQARRVTESAHSATI